MNKERIICITGTFNITDKYGIPTGQTEFVVSHGVGEESLNNYPLPNEHPSRLGAIFDPRIGEWVLCT